MLAVLPLELVENIAKNLPDKKALRAFAQVCSRTLVPGRRYLFRDCRVRVGEFTATVRSFTHDVARQTDISGVIRCLHLDSYYPDGPTGTQITLCELLTLVHEIPRLESLVLEGFEWCPSPEKVLVRPHPKLANIDLRMIFSECSRACPLEVLCLADRWSSVNIADFTCGPIAYTPQTDANAHSVRSLCCEWCPITGDWNFGFTSGCPIIKDLTVVEFRALVDEGCMLVHDMVLQQARTLERLIIRISGDYQIRRFAVWRTLFLDLAWCRALSYVEITLPVSRAWFRRRPHGGNFTRGGHIEVIRLALKLLPPSVRCVHIVVDTTLCHSVSAAKSLIQTALTWSVMARILAMKTTIIAVAISLEYAKLPEVRWTEADVHAVTELYLEGFPFMSGSVAGAHWRCYRSEHLKTIADGYIGEQR